MTALAISVKTRKKLSKNDAGVDLFSSRNYVLAGFRG
jgi:hypothetical protein